MMCKILNCLTFIALINATINHDISKEEWQTYKLQYGKNYENARENDKRFKIYHENKHWIAQHNQLFYEGKVTYEMGVNAFADMNLQEFAQKMLFMNSTFTADDATFIESSTFIAPAYTFVPRKIDWRRKGAVTAVKNQGNCAAGWAFAAIGAVEGQKFRKSKVLTSLSEQNLIDCSHDDDNDGCSGGFTWSAYKHIDRKGGIDTTKSYPYTAKEQKCQFNTHAIGAKVVGAVHIRSGDEKQLKKAVASSGPIAADIDAYHRSFQFYRQGIYNEPNCYRQDADHSVLIVGYGAVGKRNDYWLVKNSFGSGWGESGYIRLSRNRNNQCGIATSATYPLVE